SSSDDGDGSAWFAQVSYPNDLHEASIEALRVGENFDPALGFVPRRGIRRYRGSYAYAPRLGTLVRQLKMQLRPELVTEEDGRTVSAQTLLRVAELEFESGDELRFDVVNFREVLDDPFDIRDGQSIDAGAYTFLRYGFVAESSSHRPVDARLSVFAGEFWDGDRVDVGLDLGFRPGNWGAFAFEYDRNGIKLPGDDFVVHVARARANLQFGPRLSWSNFVQWDNQSEQLGLNSRLWWILQPGNELFFVVNQGWEWDPDRGVTPEDSNIALKLGYTLRM
ncbi:MAG: hypothetical protein ACI8PQ_002398, partial [Planctomycetota bacterium]